MISPLLLAQHSLISSSNVYTLFHFCAHSVAPSIMTPRMVQAAASSPRTSQGRSFKSSGITTGVDFNTLGRAPLRLTLQRRVTSTDLEILESTHDLLLTPIPEAEGVAKEVSLLKGFNATIPSSEKGKARRRKTRNLQLDEEDEEDVESDFKRLGLQSRGMLTEGPHNTSGDEGHGTVRKKRKSSRKSGDAVKASKILGKDELNRQRKEILQDKENLHVRRVRVSLISLNPIPISILRD